MEEDSGSSRRKACDLCFTKKIKCDMLKPTCSNCKLYHSQCRTTSIRRRPKPKPRVPGEDVVGPSLFVESVPATVDSTPREGSAVEARLDRIEAQLREMQGKGDGAQDEAAWPDDEVDCLVPSTPRWTFNCAAPTLYYGPPDGTPTLPTLENIIPVIDRYFNTTNRIHPLFDQPSFMRTLTSWYNKPTDRSRPAWSLILTVATLGLRSELDLPAHHHRHQVGLFSLSQDKTRLADYCMRNAQSAMAELVSRGEDLTGIRVLLALATVFLDSLDLSPAVVLIGSAVRLAHRLRLHSKGSEQYFNEQENLERSRVFWIAYIYDKAISLRAKMPSAQLDADIDIPIPPMHPPDGLGVIHTLDGSESLNIFRLRVNLAHIEGKVHDLLYSNRASKIPVPERQRRVDALQALLDRWYGGIPLAFNLTGLSARVVAPTDLVELNLLYHAFLLCVVSIHGVYSFQAEWMGHLGSQGRAAVEDYARNMQNIGDATCTRMNGAAPGDKGWRKCIEVSRGCMRVFHETRLTERILWRCFCPHFSGLIVLLANMIIAPMEDGVAADQLLTAKSTALLAGASAFTEGRPPMFGGVQRLVEGLSASAARAVRQAQEEREMMMGAALEGTGLGFADGGGERFDGDGGGFGEWEFEGLFDPESVVPGCAFFE